MMSRRVPLLAALLVAAAPLAAQDSPWTEVRFHRVHLRNGNFVDGTLVKQNAREVVLRIQSGEISIKGDVIDRLEFVKIRSINEKPKLVEAPRAAPAGGRPSSVEGAPAVPPPPAAKASVLGADAQKAGPAVLEILVKAKKLPAEERFEVAKQILPLGKNAAIFMAGSLEKFPEEDLAQLVSPLLIEMKSTDAAPLLVEKLGNPSPMARAFAAGILSKYGDPAALQHIHPLLADKDVAVRQSAVNAVLEIGSRDSVGPLGQLGLDADANIRSTALSGYIALAKKHDLYDDVGHTLGVLLDRAGSQARRDILVALSSARIKTTWETVSRHLADPDPLVRTAAVVALTAIEAPQSGDAIVAQIRAEQENTVRPSLADAAQKLRLGPAVPFLIDWLEIDNAQVKGSSMEALRTLTAQNYGFEVQKWREWWALNGK